MLDVDLIKLNVHFTVVHIRGTHPRARYVTWHIGLNATEYMRGTRPWAATRTLQRARAPGNIGRQHGVL
jgi:hypothetical protein